MLSTIGCILEDNSCDNLSFDISIYGIGNNSDATALPLILSFCLIPYIIVPPFALAIALTSFANSSFHFGFSLANELLYSNSVDSSISLSINDCKSSMVSNFIFHL